MIEHDGDRSNPLMELVKQRRSIRDFREEAVPLGLLRSLVEAGRWAPSGSNAQPWVFVVVTDPVKVRKLKLFSPGLAGDPPVLVVVCDDTSRRGSTHIMDLCMATQTILLAATSAGLGSCPVHSFNKKGVGALLDAPSHIVPQLLIAIGHAAGRTEAVRRRPVGDTVYWNSYGKRREKS